MPHALSPPLLLAFLVSILLQTVLQARGCGHKYVDADPFLGDAVKALSSRKPAVANLQAAHLLSTLMILLTESEELQFGMLKRLHLL